MDYPQNSGNNPARPNETQPTPDAALDAAVQEAGEYPERAAELAEELAVGENVALKPSRDPALGADAPISEESDGDDPDEEDEDEEDEDEDEEINRLLFFRAETIRLRGREAILEDAIDHSMLLSVILAFCSYEDRQADKAPPVTPLPHLSGRAHNKLIFAVDGRQLQPTLTGFHFTRWDHVDVDTGEHRTNYNKEGGLVVAIVNSSLTLLELREDKDCLIRFYDLERGEMLEDNAHLIIGGVRSIHHHYEGPERPEDRAFDRALDEGLREGRKRKGVDWKPNPNRFDANYARFLQQERAAQSVVAEHTAPPEPTPDAEQSFEALLSGLKRMCSHNPLLIGQEAGIADAEPMASDLYPAPDAVTNDSGLIALTARDEYDHPTAHGWTIVDGDTLVVEPDGEYGPGDTVLVACVGDELTLANVQGDDALIWLRENEPLNRAKTVVIGPVVELRKGRGAQKKR